MKREFVVVFVAVLLIPLVLPGAGHCGYSMDSTWRDDSNRFWYIIEIESGSPPPFRDLHVDTEDPNPAHYTLAKAPEGWQMSIVPKNDGTGQAWISIYGDEPCSGSDFRVEYSGPYSTRSASHWHLTEDGDPDPDTGLIPGESGFGAHGVWFTGGNAGVKVGVHVLPHERRTCISGQPSLTSCSDIVATCEANDVDFFPVFFDLSEYQCLEYSVEWPGTYSCIFTPCTSHNIGRIVWPAGTVPEEEATDRISQCHDGCRTGPIAIPGWGWIYEPGPATIRIVPCPATGQIGVLDCDQHIDQPICNFAAGIGGALGEQPCAPSVTEPKTWGAIKAMFE